MKFKFFLILFALCLGLIFKLESYEGNGANRDCNTTSLFKDKITKVTFFGDSRMDYVDQPGVYGAQSMHQIIDRSSLNPNIDFPDNEKFKEEGVQNLGVDGWRTTDILDNLNNCISNTNFKVANRFVYHAGGNNFLQNGVIAVALQENANKNPIFALAFPFFFEFSKFVVRDEVQRTVQVLIKSYRASETNEGKSDILLIGGYATAFLFTPYSNTYMLQQNCVPVGGSTSTLAGSMLNVNPVPVAMAGTLAWCGLTQSLPNDLLNQISPGKTGLNGFQFFLNAGIFLTAGLSQMDEIYKEIAKVENVHYLSVWNEMSNFSFLGDPIHPNEAGFNQWGLLVGKKLREINFHSPIQEQPLNSPIQTGNHWIDIENNLRYTQSLLRLKIADLEVKRKELLEREMKLREIQERIREAEYKLTLIKQRIEKLDFQIAETKNKIADLDIQIADAQREGKLELAAKLAEAKRIEDARLAELARQKAVADQERIAKEQELALIEAQRVEAEHQAYIARQAFEAAEAAARAAQAAHDAAIAAAEKAKKDQEFLQLLALCVFFGICR